MSKKDARNVIMQATRDAMEMWKALHPENPMADLDARLDFINRFVEGIVPSEVRAAAV